MAIGWGQSANKEKLLESFSSFPPKVRALLEKAPQDGVQAWNLLDRPEVKRWAKGRTVLLGDAAHPFLPCKRIYRKFYIAHLTS